MKPFFATSTNLLALFLASTVALGARSDAINFYELTGMTELKNGIYHLTYTTDNSPVIDITLFPDASEPISNSVTPEQLMSRAAGCDGFSLDHGQTDAANAGLQGTCGGGKYGTTWVVNGDVVAFYCQHDSSSKCTAQSSIAANQWVTNACGLYGAGSYTGGGYSYGYTNWRIHDFCGIVL